MGDPVLTLFKKMHTQQEQHKQLASLVERLAQMLLTYVSKDPETTVNELDAIGKLCEEAQLLTK